MLADAIENCGLDPTYPTYYATLPSNSWNAFQYIAGVRRSREAGSLMSLLEPAQAPAMADPAAKRQRLSTAICFGDMSKLGMFFNGLLRPQQAGKSLKSTLHLTILLESSSNWCFEHCVKMR